MSFHIFILIHFNIWNCVWSFTEISSCQIWEKWRLLLLLKIVLQKSTLIIRSDSPNWANKTKKVFQWATINNPKTGIFKFSTGTTEISFPFPTTTREAVHPHIREWSRIFFLLTKTNSPLEALISGCHTETPCHPQFICYVMLCSKISIAFSKPCR